MIPPNSVSEAKSIILALTIVGREKKNVTHLKEIIDIFITR